MDTGSASAIKEEITAFWTIWNDKTIWTDEDYLVVLHDWVKSAERIRNLLIRKPYWLYWYTTKMREDHMRNVTNAENGAEWASELFSISHYLRNCPSRSYKHVKESIVSLAFTRNITLDDMARLQFQQTHAMPPTWEMFQRLRNEELRNRRIVIGGKVIDHEWYLA